MKNRLYKRSKKAWADEAAAIADVAAVQNLRPKQVIAGAIHTETEFVFAIPVKAAADGQPEKKGVAFSKADFELKDATEAAMDALEVDEGNLVADHDEEYYAFFRSRG